MAPSYGISYPITGPRSYGVSPALLGVVGPQIQLSNATIPDTTASGSTVGTLSVTGATGTPTFSLSSNPGALFSITGTSLNTAATLSAGSYPITVHVTGMTPAPPDKAFLITVTHAGTAALKFNLASNSQYIPLLEDI